MMGLGKLQRLAKFEVAGFIYDKNIRESVYRRQNSFLSHTLGGLRGNVRTSSIAR